MKKPPSTLPFLSFSTLLILQVLFYLSFSTLPIDFVIQPSTCTSNSNCPHYRYSKCNASNQCDQCANSADCAHFSESETVDCTLGVGSPSFKYCAVPCSTYNKEPCIKMRTRCLLGKCRQCSTDTQCQTEGYPGVAADLWCDEVSVPGLAVCSSCPKTGCPGSSVCQNFKCVECSSDGDCGASTPHCEMKFEGNFCRACLENNHCTTAALSKCSSYSCIKCTDDNDCGHISGKPNCLSTTGCVECYNHDHCSGVNDYCSAGNQCVECTEDGHCASGHCVGNICVECEQDIHCTSPSNPKCSSSNTCGPCSNPTTVCSDNFPAKPFCSSGGGCVQCEDHSHCQNSNLPECSISTYICQPCSGSTFCSSLGINLNQCATTGSNAGECVQCISDGDCSGSLNQCLETTNICVECIDHGDFPDPQKPQCSGNTCQPCPNSAFCSSLPSTPNQCALTGPNTGKCVECVDDSHCSGTTPGCSATSNTCVECKDHSHCQDSTKPRCSSNTCQPCSDSTFCSSLPSAPDQCALTGPNTGKCVECTGNGDCSGTTPVCFATSNTCVECTINSDCLDPAKPQCSSNTCQPCPNSAFCSSLPNLPDQCSLTGPNTGKCVECTDNSHCSGITPGCSATSNTCVECTDNSHCTDPSAPFCSANTCQPCPDSPFCAGKYPGDLPYCLSGTCVECTAPGHCPGSTCSSSNTCVECSTNSECPTTQLPLCSSSTCQSCSTSPGICAARFPNKPVCLSTNGECVQCETSTHCASFSSQTQCDSATHTCVECTDHSHCQDSTKPRCSENTCQPCSDSTFCSSLPSAPDQCALTGPNTGKCVECTDDSHCSGTTSICSATSNTCVECTINSDCLDPTKPQCSSNTCQPCPNSAFCSSLPNLPDQCALTGPNTGKCVDCVDASHCSGTTSVCFTTSNTCVECTINSDCLDPAQPQCSGNTCRPCPDSAFCSSLPSAPDQCALTGPNTGRCVECTDNGHCSGTTSICSTTSNTCVECTDNSHCTDPYAPFCSANTCQPCPDSPFCAGKYPGDLPYCLSGACVECTATADCSAPTAYCSSSKTCVECTSHSHCPISLPLCSSSTCQSCSSSPGVCATRFTNKPVCSSGGCVECEISSHCPTSKPQCNSATHTCVECTDHSHCQDPIKPFCGASNTCQSCSSAGTTFCSTKYPGILPYCLTGTGACVECTQSSDCLDPLTPNCINNICQATVYQSQCSPSYNIQIKQVPTKLSQFDFYFPSDLASKVDIQSTLTLTLQNIPQSDYAYTLNKLTNTHYEAIFTTQITTPSTKLRLQLPCPSQPGFIFGDIILYIQIQSIPFIDPELAKTINTIDNIATVTTNVIAGASGSMILAGSNPALMWALIGLLQAFYYMIFINVQYPINVQAFFGLFSLGNLPFIPNPIEWFFPEIEGVDLQAPEKFLENDVDGLFLQTAGNMLLTWFLVLVGYLVSKFILKFTRNMPRILIRAAFKTVKIFEWSGVIRTFMTSYTQLTLAAFLQIRVLNFDRKLYGVSSLTGITFTIFAFAFPPVLILLIHKFSKYPKVLNTTFSTLTDEFKYDKEKLIPIYFNAFFLLRRLVLILALVFLHDYPYLEVIILILNCMIWLILLLKYLPYDKKMHNIVNIISELLFVLIHVLILLFAHDDNKGWLTEKKKLHLGWIIISCCGVILGLTFIVACIEQYFVIKDFIQLLMKFLKGRKPSSSSQRVKKKSSPQRSTQNSILNSRNTSTDDLDNSMTLMPFVPLQNVTHQRRRIVRPPRKNNETSKSPTPMTRVNNRTPVASLNNNRRPVIHNHIRDLIMYGNNRGPRTQHMRMKNV